METRDSPNTTEQPDWAWNLDWTHFLLSETTDSQSRQSKADESEVTKYREENSIKVIQVKKMLISSQQTWFSSLLQDRHEAAAPQLWQQRRWQQWLLGVPGGFIMVTSHRFKSVVTAIKWASLTCKTSNKWLSSTRCVDGFLQWHFWLVSTDFWALHWQKSSVHKYG